MAEENQYDDDEPQEEIIRRRQGVPLRCGVDGVTRNGVQRSAKCRGCMKVVKDTDVATVCDLRNGWWHNSCAQKLNRDEGNVYKNFINPENVGEDEPWVCPQCMYHLCRNDDRSRDLCVMCGKPSARSGGDMGTDMVSCDGRWGGLFHKSCARYDEAEEIREENETWFCLACDSLDVNAAGVDGDEPEIVEEVSLHENTIPALLGAIDKALAALPRAAFERGFESRRVFMEKIIEAEGRNDYKMHFRGERKRREKGVQRGRKKKINIVFSAHLWSTFVLRVHLQHKLPSVAHQKSHVFVFPPSCFPESKQQDRGLDSLVNSQEHQWIAKLWVQDTVSRLCWRHIQKKIYCDASKKQSELSRRCKQCRVAPGYQPCDA